MNIVLGSVIALLVLVMEKSIVEIQMICLVKKLVLQMIRFASYMRKLNLYVIAYQVLVIKNKSLYLKS